MLQAYKLTSQCNASVHVVLMFSSVSTGTFNWKDEGTYESTTLSGINLSVSTAQLVAVCGSVGSGKTSVCNAVLEELVRLRGTVDVTGSVAFVPQTPFTLNNTLRENILFGKPWDVDKYRETLRLCCLEQAGDAAHRSDTACMCSRAVHGALRPPPASSS